MRAVFDPATKADLDLILSLTSENYSSAGYPYEEKLMRQALAELLENARLGRLWLIKADEKVIGYMLVTFGFILEFYGRHAVLDELYLLSAYRALGIGRKAVSFAEEYCRKARVGTLRLEVEVLNTRAQKLYRNAGFISHDRIVMTKMLK